MSNRFQGYVTDDGFYILDTATGAVKLVTPDGEDEVREWGIPLALPVQAQTAIDPIISATTSVLPHSSLDPLDMMVLSSFPYPIATTYHSYISESDPRLRCKLLVDTFTNVIKMWALQIASEYLIAEGVKDTAVNQTLSRDFQRPLISAWNLMLHRCIPVLQEANVAFFSPDLPRCYERLESRCKDKFSVKKRYEDKDGNSKFKISKLGKIQAMIKYRNSLAHGYNQSTQQAEKELATYVPLLREILDAAKFMIRTPLCMLKKQGAMYKVVRLMGLSPTPDAMEIPKLDLDPDTSPVFLYDSNQQRVLPLFTFFDVDQSEGDGMGLNQDVFLFEGRTKKSMIYLSTQGEHLEKQSKYNYWVELLSKKHLKIELISPDKLDLNMLDAACNRINNRSLAKLRQNGRYIPEVCEFRSDYHKNMQQFVAGNFRTFLLTGDSGVGKTSYLAQLVERSHNITLFYSASELRNTDLGSKLLRDMGFRSMYFEDFLANSTEHFRKADRKFFLVIDALNTFSGSLTELLNAINQLTEQVEDYPWFRIVVSIRPAPYARSTTKLRASFPQGLFTIEDSLNPGVRTSEIRMLNLPAELLPDCYEGYRRYRYVDPEDEEDPGVYVYRPRTAFSELDSKGSTLELLRQPMMLRLIMSTFHRRVLPSTLTDDEIMPIFLEQIVVEAQGPSGGYPNRKRFLMALARHLLALKVESARVEDLYEVPALEKELRNRQPDSAYVQLIEMGLLQETWEDDDAYVSFSMDELLSFLLAQILEPKIRTASDILIWSQNNQHFFPMSDALRIIIQRAVRDGRGHFITDALDLVEIINEKIKEDSILIMHQCERVLYSMCINNDQGLPVLLRQFEEKPSWGDLLLLQSLVERCLVNGTLGHIDLLLASIEREAKVLGTKAILTSVRLHLKVFVRMGRMNEAISCFENYKSIGTERCDEIWAEVLFFAFKAYAFTNQNDVAEEIYERTIGFTSLSPAIKISFLIQMGSLRLDQDRPNEAGTLYNEGLKLAEAFQLPVNQADTLCRLAVYKIKIGEEEGAVDNWLVGLSIAAELGDKALQTKIYNNLGCYSSEIGKYDIAKEHFSKGIELAVAMGLKRHEAYLNMNLGLCYWKMSDARSVQLVKYALELFQKSNIIDLVACCHFRILIMSRENSIEIEHCYSKLLQLSESAIDYRFPLWIAGAKLTDAIERDDIDTVLFSVYELREKRSEINVPVVDVDLGPLFPWIYAAQYLERAERNAEIVPIISMIDAELDGRIFHMQDELERLRELTL